MQHSTISTVSLYSDTEPPGLNPAPGIRYIECDSQLWGIPEPSYQLFTKEETFARGKGLGTFLMLSADTECHPGISTSISQKQNCIFVLPTEF